MSTWSEINPFRNGRFYYLAIHDQVLQPDSAWEAMSGGVRLKPLSALHFARSLNKAAMSGYSALVFPSNSVQHSQFENFVEQVVKRGLKPILQVSSELYSRVWALHGERLEALPLHFEFILESVPGNLSLFHKLLDEGRVHFTVPGFKSAPVWQQLDRIPMEFYPQLHFYFPYQFQKKKIFSPQQIMDVKDFFSQRQKNFSLKPPLGVDLYEPRIESHRELEPEVQPVLVQNSVARPLVSVVIPAFNNGKYLVNTLRHLEQQNISKTDYEVVVVDDGSSDQTSELTLEALQNFKMAVTYIYYPRMKPRQMGDSQFRAGLARNLGVRFAKGEILAFLDSDIITPENFLERTIDLHKEHDVIQWRRDYLNKHVDSPRMKYSEVVASDCFIPEGGYWHKFYTVAETTPWGQIPDHWKYVCTYGFSLRRQVFKDLGWFRKTFCFYGFEDTDLGWRLAQAGYKFHFNNEPVYHLFHETGRSEFGNSFFLRQKLLKNTARIFFNNNLSPEIFRVFKYLLKDNVFF